jgi:hypothetical protein
VGAPGARREPQAVRANPPRGNAGAGLRPPAAPEGAPAGPAAAGPGPPALPAGVPPGPAAPGPGPRAVLEGSPPPVQAAGRRGCPRQAGAFGPPDAASSMESRPLGLEHCRGLEQRSYLGRSTGWEGTAGLQGVLGSEGTPKSEGVLVLEGVLEFQATLRLEPLPPSSGVPCSHGGPTDRCRTSSRVEQAAAPLPARDRWEAEADRRWDGGRSAPPAPFRIPVPERPAGTSPRPVPPQARAIPPCARPTPPHARPTPPPPRPARPGPPPTAPHARSTRYHALRTPPRPLTRLGARSKRPPLRRAPFPVPPPRGPNLLRGAAPAQWPRPTRPRPRSPKPGRPLGHRLAQGPPPLPVEAREPGSPPGTTLATSRAGRDRRLPGAVRPLQAARRPDAPIRRVARAGRRTARGRAAPHRRRTDRTRSRRDRGLTSQETPRERARHGPEPGRPRLVDRPRAGRSEAWKRWSPPRRGPATRPTMAPARAVRPVLAGLVRDALAGGWDQSSGPRMLPCLAPRTGVEPSLSRRGRFCEDCPQPGKVPYPRPPLRVRLEPSRSQRCQLHKESPWPSRPTPSPPTSPS